MWVVANTTGASCGIAATESTTVDAFLTESGTSLNLPFDDHKTILSLPIALPSDSASGHN